VNDHENNREYDTGEKDEDAAEHVDKEVANTKGAEHHQSRMVLLHGLQLDLSIGEIVQRPKQDGHGENSQEHLARVEETDEEEDEKGRDEVVCLVIQQVVDNPVDPFLRVVKVRCLEPGFSKNEFVQTTQRCNLYLVHFSS